MTRGPRRGRAALAFGAALCGAAAAGGAEHAADEDAGDRAGIFADRVLFGQSAAFSGPARDLGAEMKAGIEAAFGEANANGGIHGRRLELLSLDDAYEPEAAIANTRRLIEEEGVFALIGAVGTPTSRAAVPISTDAGVPYVAPFTGAAFLRDPSRRNIVNLRASYYQETETIVDRLVRDLGIDRVAVLFQDDSFGRAGYEGVRRALRRRDLTPVATGVYPRNTTAVKTALLDLRRGDPGAVVLVGAYRPVAELIAWARRIQFAPVFLTISFVGGRALVDELGEHGEGVFVTQVAPYPGADSPPAAPAYRRALAAIAPDARPGFVSFEGYLAGRLAILGLERCGEALGRTCFLEALLGLESADIDGFALGFGPRDNQGSDAVFLTVVDADGDYRPVDTLASAARP